MLSLQTDKETACIQKTELSPSSLPGGLNEDETQFALAPQITF